MKTLKKITILCSFLLVCTLVFPQLRVISNGNLGIGISSPAEKLHLNGSIRGNQSCGALRINGSYKYVDIGSKYSNGYHTHFYTNTTFGYWFDKGLMIGDGIITTYGAVDLQLKTYANEGNAKVIIKNSNGYVGINENDPDYRLHVNGVVWADDYLPSSGDSTLKRNIEDYTNTLSNLKMLRPITYNRKKPEMKFIEINDTIIPNVDTNFQSVEEELTSEEMEYYNRKHFGLIAQEVESIFPELVYTDSKGIKSISYMGLIPILITAVKEQQILIDTLSSRIEKLSPENSNLKSNVTSDYGNNTSKQVNHLIQNRPNPFNQETAIEFYISSESSYAELNFYDMQGTQIKSYNIKERGNASIIIYGSELNPGMYLYTLIVDGTEVDTKRMILTD